MKQLNYRPEEAGNNTQPPTIQQNIKNTNRNISAHGPKLSNAKLPNKNHYLSPHDYSTGECRLSIRTPWTRQSRIFSWIIVTIWYKVTKQPGLYTCSLFWFSVCVVKINYCEINLKHKLIKTTDVHKAGVGSQIKMRFKIWLAVWVCVGWMCNAWRNNYNKMYKNKSKLLKITWHIWCLSPFSWTNRNYSRFSCNAASINERVTILKQESTRPYHSLWYGCEQGPVHTWCYHWSEAAFTVAVSQFKPPMRCSSKAFIFIRRAPRPSVKGALLLQRRLHEMIQRLMPCSGPVGATVHCLHNILYEPNSVGFTTVNLQIFGLWSIWGLYSEFVRPASAWYLFRRRILNLFWPVCSAHLS